MENMDLQINASQWALIESSLLTPRDDACIPLDNLIKSAPCQPAD